MYEYTFYTFRDNIVSVSDALNDIVEVYANMVFGELTFSRITLQTLTLMSLMLSLAKNNICLPVFSIIQEM